MTPSSLTNSPYSVPQKVPGTRWRFESAHLSVRHRTGQTCTLVEQIQWGNWPFVVEFADGKRTVALERELVEAVS